MHFHARHRLAWCAHGARAHAAAGHARGVGGRMRACAWWGGSIHACMRARAHAVPQGLLGCQQREALRSQRLLSASSGGAGRRREAEVHAMQRGGRCVHAPCRLQAAGRMVPRMAHLVAWRGGRTGGGGGRARLMGGDGPVGACAPAAAAGPDAITAATCCGAACPATKASAPNPLPAPLSRSIRHHSSLRAARHPARPRRRRSCAPPACVWGLG